MNIESITEAFVKAVDNLIEVEQKNNTRLHVKTNNNNYINFKVTDFKKSLNAQINLPIEEYLKIYRTLNWIKTSNSKLFTNTQKIDGKTIRVITVDYKKYETLKNIF